MEEDSSSENRVKELVKKPDSSWIAKRYETRKRGGGSSSYMGSIFCNSGEASSEGKAKSTIDNMPGFRRASNDGSSGKKARSSTGRRPLSSTDVLNKVLSQDTEATPQNLSGCDAFGALLSGRKGFKVAQSQICNCGGSCGPCLDAHSNSQKLLSSCGLTSPTSASNSIPVIEALGVTPKSKDRRSKYNVSGAMNPPGIIIPTPAPVKKKYRPAFDNIAEITSAAESVKDGVESIKEDGTNEDAFLPDDFSKPKDSPKTYTEAELQQRVQQALAEREKEFTERMASVSEDSDIRFQKQLQEHLQQQGTLWNKDLQERLEDNRNHYKKKQTALKNHIAELENQCKNLERSHDEKILEHQKQTEELRRQLSTNRDKHQKQTEQLQLQYSTSEQANEEERTKLLEEIAKKSEELSKVDEKESSQQEELHCTPSFIRDLHNKVGTLQTQKDEAEKRATALEKQVISVEGNIVNHISALAGVKDERRLDKLKIVKLETQLEAVRKEKASLQEEIKALVLKNNNAHSNSNEEVVAPAGEDATTGDKTGPERKVPDFTKVKRVLQNCIQTLSGSAPDAITITATPSDEMDSPDISSHLETLEKLAHTMSDRIEQAEATAKCAIDARVEAELELGRVTESFGTAKETAEEKRESNETETNDISEVASYWEQKASGTPQGEGSSNEPFTSRAQLQSQAVALLKKEVKSIQHLCATQGGPAKDLLGDYAAELYTKVGQVGEQLEMLQQHQVLKGFALPVDPRSQQSQQQPVEKVVGTPDLVRQIADLESKLSAVEAELSRKSEAAADVETKHADVVSELKLSQEQNENLQQQVKNFIAGRSVGDTASISESTYMSSLEGDEIQVEELLVMLEMKQEQEKLTDKIREQEEAAISLQTAKQTLEENVSDLKEKSDALSNDLDQRNKEVESLREDKNELSRQLADLTDQRDASSKALDERDSQIQALERDQGGFKEKLVDLTEKYDVSSNTLEERDSQIESLKRDQSGFKEKLYDLTQQRDDLAKAVEEKSDKLISLARSTTKKALERTFLTSKLDLIVASIDGGMTEEQSSDDLQKVATLEAHLNESIKKINDLQKQNESLTSTKSELDETIHQLRSKTQELEKNLLNRQNEIEASATQIACLKKDIALAREEMSNICSQHEEAVKSLSSQSGLREELHAEKERLLQQVAELKATLENVNKERDLEAAAAGEREQNQQIANEKCNELRDLLTESKSEASKLTVRVMELESLLQTTSAECERLDQLLELRPGNIEEELLRRSADLEAKSNETIAKCEEQVRQCREEHAKEIDEMLAQLDLVEAEHNERFSEKEKAVKEKDVVISTLGTKLTESQGSITSLQASISQQLQEVEKAQNEAAAAKGDAQALKEELEKIRKHQDEAIIAAREETIKEATAQFDQYNEMYRAMRNKCNAAESKVQALETDLLASKTEAEKMAKEHASSVASMRSALADAKAAHSQEEAATARELKEHQEAQQVLQTRLSEAEMSNRSVQKILATVVSEKEELISENEDLKCMCEEAMSLAETTQS